RREHPDIYPPNGGLTFDILPLREQVVGNVRRSVVVLVCAAGFVLVISCANVASLLLSRALGRPRGIAIRTAIGASRARIIRQLLIESLALALAGGAVSVGFAFAALEWMRRQGIRSVPRLHEIGIDAGMFAVTLALSVASGVLFGLLPALRLCR